MDPREQAKRPVRTNNDLRRPANNATTAAEMRRARFRALGMDLSQGASRSVSVAVPNDRIPAPDPTREEKAAAAPMVTGHQLGGTGAGQILGGKRRLNPQERQLSVDRRAKAGKKVQMELQQELQAGFYNHSLCFQRRYHSLV